MILTHGANSIERIPPVPTSVHIKDHDYQLKQIGSLLWITENLYETIGTSGTDYVTNPNHPAAGKYYATSKGGNTSIQTKLEPYLPEGWRLPTDVELSNLRLLCPTWADFLAVQENGNDILGMNMRITQYASTKPPSWNGYDNNVVLLSNNYKRAYCCWSDGSAYREPYFACIRLVKDAT